MTPRDILEALPGKSALIVGDICMDRWSTYDPREAEPSRETGLPRIAVVATTVTPGAGGTVANNVKALGFGRVAVLGAVGTDGFGFELKQALEQGGIENELVESADIATFTYSKLINGETGEEDLPRVDFIRTTDMPEAVESQIVNRLSELAAEFDAILVSDQAETAFGGVVTEAVRNSLATLAVQYPQKVIWVDSRNRPHLFRNVIVKVNEEESRRFEPDAVVFRNEAKLPLLCITRGPRGAQLVSAAGETFVSTILIQDPVDICGAGDSFSAGMVAGLVAGATPEEAATLGNRVASITVMKRGTGTASPSEVLNVS